MKPVILAYSRLTQGGKLVASRLGCRFIYRELDRLEDEVIAVKSKVDGTNRRLDNEAMERTDLKLARRMHELEEETFGPGHSKHPKHVVL